MKPEIKVWFSQYGTWGGRSFTGVLTWGDKEPLDILYMLAGSEPAPKPVIILDDDQDGWSGLQLFPGQTMPGRFASGYEDPLSGKYYAGRMDLGDSAHGLRPAGPPSDVFEGRPTYLHLADPDVPLTAEQRELLLAAVRFDLDRRFEAGADITALFSREELEGDKAGQIYYA